MAAATAAAFMQAAATAASMEEAREAAAAAEVASAIAAVSAGVRGLLRWAASPPSWSLAHVLGRTRRTGTSGATAPPRPGAPPRVAVNRPKSMT